MRSLLLRTDSAETLCETPPLQSPGLMSEKASFGLSSAPKRPPLGRRISSSFSLPPANWPEHSKRCLQPVREWSRRARVVYGSIGVLLLVLGLSTFLSYRHQLFSTGAGIRYADPLPADGGVLTGQLSSVNPYTHQVVINWFWNADGSYLGGNVDGQPGDFLNVDSVYAYTNGINGSVGAYSRRFESMWTRQSFTTTHKTSPADNYKASVTRASSALYPFDVYNVNASFAIVQPSSNTTVPLVSCAVATSVTGWSIVSQNWLEPYHGVAFSGQGCVLQLTLQRDTVAKSFACVILLLMWTVSLLVLHLTLRTTLLGQKIQGSMPAFPATILFALPALRATLPDTPPFGVNIDVFCLMLNELIVGLSLVALITIQAVDRDSHTPGVRAPTPIPTLRVPDTALRGV